MRNASRKKQFAWSISALKSYEDCPRRYAMVKVYKTFKEDFGTAADYGKYVHKALELYVKNGKALPLDIQHLQQYAVPFREMKKVKGVDVLTEQQLTLNTDYELTGWFDSDAWVRSIADIIITGDKAVLFVDWKGLPLHTPLPTPSGWSTMGDIRVGDTVFDGNGRTTVVIGKSVVKHLPNYELEFDDATTIACDSEHLWTTKEASAVLVTDLQVGDYIPVAYPLVLPHCILPVPPYTLGYWIGNGSKCAGKITSATWDIAEIADHITSDGYELGGWGKVRSNCLSPTIYGLSPLLRKAGVLNNKHIPAQYLRASYAQRVALVQGLMDSDGNANPHRKQAVFTTVKKHLAYEVNELLLSLGMRSTVSKINTSGFGKKLVAYYVQFRPKVFNPFRLLRKADQILLDEWGPGRSGFRRITSITKQAVQPSQCIAVASDAHTFLCGRQFCVTHNTNGKIGDDNFIQLRLLAAMFSIAQPKYEEFHMEYRWLKHKGASTNLSLTKSEVAETWPELLPRVEIMATAVKEENYPARPSGLCKNYCPVKSCAHCGI